MTVSQSFMGFDIDSINAADVDAFLEARTNHRGDPNWQALAELLRWVHQAEAGSDFAAEIGDWIDERGQKSRPRQL